MWILVVITLLLSNTNLAQDVRLEKKLAFKTEVACNQVVIEYNDAAQRSSWQGSRPKAFCVYDSLSSDDLIKQLDSLDKALEKIFPNKKK